PLPPGETFEGKDEKPLELEKTEFTLTFPWFADAYKIKIFEEGENLVFEGLLDLEKAEKIENLPNFKSVKAKEILEERKGEGLINFLDKLIFQAEAAIVGDGYLDITFIGEDFSFDNLSLFHNNVQNFSTYLVTQYEPFISRVSQIRFNYVDNTQDLGCNYNGRLIICNTSLITQKVNSASVPYDIIGVIVNNSNYGGAGYFEMAVAYNGAWGKQVFVHELGHSLGELNDEYLCNYSGFRTDRNCYNGVPPNPAWQGIVPAESYYPECNYSNWYRSTQDSIMRSIDKEYFNPISIKLINEKIDYYASAKATLIFILKPQGIINCQGKPSRTIKISGGNLNNKAVEFVCTQNGFYQGRIYGLNAGSYNIAVKGWSHLKRVFLGLSVINGDNTFNLTQKELLAGELKEDNKINAYDMGEITKEYGNNQSSADFNLDGTVNGGDFRLALLNYGKRGEN
ncbi:MAG: M64 family metallopeptidase, partial [candidate division WOR-3 bacterium]